MDDVYMIIFVFLFGAIIVCTICYDIIESKKGDKLCNKVIEQLKERDIVINHSYKWISNKTGNFCHLRIINLYYDCRNKSVIIRYYLCDNEGRIGMYAYESSYVLNLIDECITELVDCGEL